ncbi:MAG: tetratricopeptide repeat protein [Salibacteraceae bacterium]
MLQTEIPDSTRFQVMKEIAWRYRNIDIEEGVRKANALVEFAEGSKNTLWLGKSHQTLSQLQRRSGAYNEALDNALKSVELYKEAENPISLGSAYNSIGLINKSQGNYPLALDFFKRSLAIDREYGTPSDIAVSLNNIGLAHYYQGEYDLALDSYLESLKIREETGDLNGAAGSFLNVGLIYHEREEYDQAASYYQQAASIFEDLDEIGNAAVCYNNLGILFFERDSSDQALDFYRKSLTIKKQLGSKSGIAGTYNNIGDMFRDLGQVDSARHYMEQSLAIRKEIGDKAGIAMINNSIGRLYLREKEYATALPYLEQSLELGQYLGAPEIVNTSAVHLSELHAERGEFEKAYRYQALAETMSDSLDNESRTREISRIEMKYQLSKKLAEREQQVAATLKLLQQREEQQDLIIGLLTLALSLVGVLILAAIGFFVLRKRFIKRTKEQKEQISKIVEVADDIIYRADAMGYFIYVNPRSVSLTGYRADELVGRHFSELVIPHQREQVVAYYRKHFLANTEPEYFEFAIHTKAGKVVWLGQKVRVARKGNQIVEFTSVARDITSFWMAKEALKKSEEKYRSLVDTMNEGLLMADNEDHIVFANRRFREMVGFGEGELSKLHSTDLLIVPEAERKRLGKVHLYREPSEQDGYEVQFQNKDGSSFWAWVSSSTTYDELGKPTGSLGVVTDISEIKAAELALLEAKEIAESSTKAKEQFLANMSHEIRTPINGIMGMAHLLGQTELFKKQQEYLESIQFSSEHLLRIVNDVLDFSKIEAGRIIFETVPFFLRQQLERTLQPLLVKAKQKKIALNLEILPEVEDHLMGDPLRLRQVLFNLVNNAIKFTDEGEVRLVVSAEAESDASKMVGDISLCFEVRDTGIGIPEDQQEYIFGNFTQANSDTTRKYGGTGLGLAIARELVQQQGGEMWLKSEKEGGSSFFFSIGYFKAPEALKLKAVQPEQENQVFSLEGIRVLVAEDNPTGQLFLKRLLESWDCELNLAGNGKEVISQLEKSTFDVVILDIQMPIMDGYTTANHIRNQLSAPTCNVPILALTAHAMPGEEERCKEAGMDGYLSKPFPPAALRDHLRLLLGNQKVPPASKGATMRIENAVEPDLSYLFEAAAGDPEFMIDIIDSFLKRNNNDLTQLEAAITTGEHQAIRKSAHYIAPTYEYVGCQSCYTLAESIEALADHLAPLERIKERFRQLKIASEESKKHLRKKCEEIRRKEQPEKFSK